jgi:hypothetical protein
MTPDQKEAIACIIELILAQRPLRAYHQFQIDTLRELVREVDSPEAVQARKIMAMNPVALIVPVIASPTLNLEGMPGIMTEVPTLTEEEMTRAYGQPDGAVNPEAVAVWADKYAVGKQLEMERAPVATLHDDGHYTWHGDKPEGFNYAGWRMDVYAKDQ